jgi:hypothetical protein
MRPLLKKTLLGLGAAAWLGAVGYGFFNLIRYENAPGDAATPLPRWPSQSAIHRNSSRASLVMVVHPQCGCTRASIGELALIMTRAQGLADAYVLFFKPSGFSEDWAKTDLWTAAAIIPGVHLRMDDLGSEARLFHASTSGTVLLYDRDGQLLFNGGITPSRGHSGDNAGRSAIVALLTGGKPQRTRTFVFGCSLLDSRRDELSQ